MPGRIGMGDVPPRLPRDQPEVPESRVLVRGTAYEAHNIWIESLIQVGLPGLVLLATGLVLTFRISAGCHNACAGHRWPRSSEP